MIIGISSLFPCLGQRLLKLRSFLLHGCLIRFHIAALPGNILQLFRNLLNGFPQLHPCLFRFLHAQAMGCQLRGGVVRPFMLTCHGNLLLMELTQCFLPFPAKGFLLCLGLLQFLPHPFKTGFAQVHGIRQFLQFPLPSQQIHRPGLGGSAGHGASGVHHIAHQGNQAEGMSAGTHNGNALVQILCDDGASQQIFHNTPIFRCTLHQLTSHPQAPGEPQRLPLPIRQ